MSLTFLQFSHKLLIGCSICSSLSFYQVIFKCHFKNPCFQLQQNVLWTNEIMRVIFASTGINGVSLAHYISYTSLVTYLFLMYMYFLKQTSLNSPWKWSHREHDQLICNWYTCTPQTECWLSIFVMHWCIKI